MVGVPRSKGCSLCVQRRVKCDQDRPQCGNCLRYGASCPGYDRSIKFVTEKHRVRQRKPAGSRSSPDSDSNSNSSSGCLAQTPSTGSEHDELGFPVAQYGMIVGLAAPRAQYISTMLSNMYNKMSPMEEGFMNSFFAHIQSKLGCQATLDSAVMSFTMHILGKACKDDRLIGESRHLYGRSLQSLQSTLNHKSEWKSTETLCATTMLCYFELFAGTKDSGSWMKHASGVAYLIQQRGPRAYMTEWDKSILRGFRAIITMDALFSGKDCFLAQPEWQAVLRKIGREVNTGTGDDERLNAVDQYFQILSKVPTVFKSVLPIHIAHLTGTFISVDREALAPLMKYAEQILSELRSWSKDLERLFPPPVEVPSKDPDSPFQGIYRYENVWEGSLYMGYWATCTVLQYSLVLGAGRDDLRESNLECCTNIYKSLETVGAGLMGPYRIGYSLHIAYLAAEPHVQRWIKGLLARYGKIYASLASSEFPNPEENSAQKIRMGFVDESIPAGMA